jgi:hypothetical protein
MSSPSRRSWFFCCAVLFAGITGSLGLAQALSASRITQRVDDRIRVTLQGNVHPLAQSRYDQGAVPDSFPAERMLLLLQRSPQQEKALQQFIHDAHTLGNSSYHQWLKPEQFGKIYGPADSDIAVVTAWLQAHGFSVARVSRGKTAIEFSGNAGQVRETFNTEIHTYLVNGEEHHANNRDPQIPAALAPVVAGITQLNDFVPKSTVEVLGRATYDPRKHQVTPEWTQNANQFLLAPGDFAVQYDLNPLYNSGTNGAGVTIGIIGASNVDPTLVATYRTLFGLPASALNVIIDGSDPGQNGALIESYLDVEVSGAVAPGAAISLYTSAGTWVQGGLNLAALRAVDDDEATVLSTSYLSCEQSLGSAGNQFWAAVWEQAAAQGQTSFVAAGDGGSAGCDDFDDAQAAQYGLSVNGISSTPWNISVGGTDFYYTSYDGTPAEQSTQLGTYWNLTPTGLPAVSLLKTIPEQPWNAPFGLNLTTGGMGSASGIIAGSGGASSCSTGVDASDGSYASCTGGYPKPAWQTGTGVPADGVRDLPDLSLFAANGENDSFYPICAEPGQCVPSGGFPGIFGVGGTSASSPSMAGIMALIDQKYGPQGQANFVLYALAAQHPSVFHDITVGSNNVPCTQGTPDCSLSTLSDNTNGFYTLGHYYATVGYDQATGLGSVDANLLLENWNLLHFMPTTTTLSLSQTTFTHGTPVTVTVGVSGSGGTPSGDVALVTTASPNVNTGLNELTLQSGGVSSKVDSFPGGQYKLNARYGGDSTFASSTSAPVTLNVTAESSKTSLYGSYYSNSNSTSGSLSNGGSYSYGTFIFIDAQPIGVNAPAGSTDGIATGTVTFTDAASTGTVSSGPVNVTSSGVGAWLPSPFLVGSHSVSASYSGDLSYNASSSTTPLGFTITKGMPLDSELSVNPNPAAVGAPAALTLQMAGVASGVLPTGTVTFYFGTTVLGAVALGPSSSNSALASATVNTTVLPLGIDDVTAVYSGDANYNSFTPPQLGVVIMQSSNFSASANPSSINETQSFTVTATVPGVAGSPAPTGYVSFTAVGGGSTWNESVTVANGSAAYTFPGSGFPVGSVLVTVSYSGDSVYAPASTTVSVAEAVPFTVAGTAVTIAAPGATTGNTSTVTVTLVDGFTGTITLGCRLTASPTGAQDPPTCNIPSSVTATGAAATATMTITSTAPASGELVSPWPNRTPWFAANGVLTLAGILFFGAPLFGIPQRGRKRRSWLSFAFVLAILASFVGCGGSSGGGGVGVPGTTAGNYTFTVTATSQGISANTTVAVTVQ